MICQAIADAADAMFAADAAIARCAITRHFLSRCRAIADIMMPEISRRRQPLRRLLPSASTFADVSIDCVTPPFADRHEPRYLILPMSYAFS